MTTLISARKILGDQKKIAIVGSAPASIRLAPYYDESWSIWGCSPGAYGVAVRKNVWFEQHRWEPSVPGYPHIAGGQAWFSPEYVRFIELFDGPVFMSQHVPSVRSCVIYPYIETLEKYGPYFFTSTVAWMLALAIEMRPQTIGLWGVDMAANSEYAFQRPGCQHFLGIAKSLGIDIVLPPESDLLQPPTLYGLSELHPRHIKLLARRREIEGRIAECTATIGAKQGELTFLRGAMDNLDYVFNTWIEDLDPELSVTLAVSNAAVVAGRLAPIEAALATDTTGEKYI